MIRAFETHAQARRNTGTLTQSQSGRARNIILHKNHLANYICIYRATLQTLTLMEFHQFLWAFLLPGSLALLLSNSCSYSSFPLFIFLGYTQNKNYKGIRATISIMIQQNNVKYELRPAVDFFLWKCLLSLEKWNRMTNSHLKFNPFF